MEVRTDMVLVPKVFNTSDSTTCRVLLRTKTGLLDWTLTNWLLTSYNPTSAKPPTSASRGRRS